MRKIILFLPAFSPSMNRTKLFPSQKFTKITLNFKMGNLIQDIVMTNNAMTSFQ